MIPYGCQDVNEDDINAVVEILKSDFLTQGPILPNFEQEVAKYVDARFGVASNSATSSLHLACLALGVGSGDRVWTSPITFVASANAAIYCGASIDFVDIDPRTYNMCPERLEAKLRQADKVGRLPKVVIPVHLAGQSCDMERIYALSQEYGFSIVEDASHAIGGSYKDDKVGSCRYSNITVFSFHPVKIITSGEGGMALTNCSDLASKMARLRSHGVTRTPVEMDKAPDGPWYYQQIDLGFNYRLTDIQAALGLSQIRRLDEFVSKRRDRADRYSDLLSDRPITIPYQHPDTHSAYHLYIIGLQDMPRPATYRREVFERFRTSGIGVNVHYIPVYHHPFYKKMGFRPDDFPEAEAYYARSITIPLFPGLTDKQQDFIVKVLDTPLSHQTIF